MSKYRQGEHFAPLEEVTKQLVEAKGPGHSR